MSSKHYPPIVIVGMHRSGTSLITQKLETLGLDIGLKKDDNFEAFTFLDLNRWILKSIQSEWDQPQDFAFFFENQALIEATVDYVKRRLARYGDTSFHGVRGLIPGVNLMNMRRRWGWKDPRTSLLLPFWMRIFPEMKIIYVERHTLDVAASLRERSVKKMKSDIARYENYKPLVGLFSKSGGFSTSARTLDLKTCVDITLAYKDIAQNHMALTRRPICRVNYEQFLENPRPILAELSSFTGLQADTNTIEKASRNIDSSRAFAYTRSPELVAFFEANRELFAD